MKWKPVNRHDFATWPDKGRWIPLCGPTWIIENERPVATDGTSYAAAFVADETESLVLVDWENTPIDPDEWYGWRYVEASA
jgi:hypothetical protein